MFAIMRYRTGEKIPEMGYEFKWVGHTKECECKTTHDRNQRHVWKYYHNIRETFPPYPTCKLPGYWEDNLPNE